MSGLNSELCFWGTRECITSTVRLMHSFSMCLFRSTSQVARPYVLVWMGRSVPMHAFRPAGTPCVASICHLLAALLWVIVLKMDEHMCNRRHSHTDMWPLHGSRLNCQHRMNVNGRKYTTSYLSTLAACLYYICRWLDWIITGGCTSIDQRNRPASYQQAVYRTVSCVVANQCMQWTALNRDER